MRYFTTESVLDQAYCFDYDMIVEQYGVNLDVVYGLTNEDECNSPYEPFSTFYNI